jgi:hypothetical protein
VISEKHLHTRALTSQRDIPRSTVDQSNLLALYSNYVYAANGYKEWSLYYCVELLSVVITDQRTTVRRIERGVSLSTVSATIRATMDNQGIIQSTPAIFSFTSSTTDVVIKVERERQTCIGLIFGG